MPARWETAVCTLIPLKPEHVELDYTAVMQSREMLRLWSGSPWPADDFTVADNLKDLQWHWREHQARLAFTYTVLTPAADQCLGCVYFKPLADLAAPGLEIGEFETAVRFWVTRPLLSTGLDGHLLQGLRQWLAAEWSFNRVLFHARAANRQQMELFAGAGLQHRFTLPIPDRGGAHQFWEE